MNRSGNRFTRFVVSLVIVTALTSASLAFRATVNEYRKYRNAESTDLGYALFVSAFALLPYLGMLASTLFSRHPRMSQRGIAVIFSGVSLLSLLGVAIFASIWAGGPTDPDGAAHLAILIYPVLMIGCLVAILVVAMILGVED